MALRLTVAILACLPVFTLCQPSNTFPKSSRHLVRRNDTIVPVYRNSSYCIQERVDDLVKRMTVEEKAGQLFQAQLWPGANGTLDEGNDYRNSTVNFVSEKLMTHFNLISDIENPREIAEYVNRLQKLASQTRLGIPITLSTDPRHGFTDNVGTGFMAGSFSQWPESLGLAAIGDPDLVQKFAEIAREEYIAVGIRTALHPQVDLATDPRWARIGQTWGEDATLTSELIVPYIHGFQGKKLGTHSVSTVTKHFPGGGPRENGEDSHFQYGKNQSYPGNNFDHHLIPFKAAIAAGARQMMPYYSRPIGTQYDPVGFAFNKEIVSDLLRVQLGFDGIVVTDWNLVTSLGGDIYPARAWGLENTTELERVTMILDAGCDQFGGESRPELVVELVQTGLLSEARLDESVRRLLVEKFTLGLFDSTFVDPDAAERIVGNDYFVRLGNEAQRRSYTLLTNKNDILPLRYVAPQTKFYIEGFNATFMEARGLSVVKTPAEADFALFRLKAPYEVRTGPIEDSFHAGSLEFPANEKARQAAIYSTVPTIIDIFLDRPAAVPEIFEEAEAVFGSFGSSTEAFLDVVFGISSPEGNLPFDLPRSVEAVEASLSDVPFDTRDPPFKFGHGLRYRDRCTSDASATRCSN